MKDVPAPKQCDVMQQGSVSGHQMQLDCTCSVENETRSCLLNLLCILGLAGLLWKGL